MKKIFLLTVVFLSFALTSTYSQERKGRPQGNRGFNREAFVKDRTDFFIKNLNLTQDEAKAFIPLFNEFMEKKFEINRDARMSRNKIRESKTDATYKAVLDAHLDAKIKEATIQKEYYQKFEKVLPIKKVFKLSKVEMDYMQKIIEDHKKGHKER